MSKKGLFSLHVVISTLKEYNSRPCPAVILIEGELIAEVVPMEAEITFEAAQDKYPDWRLRDCSEAYISPGIIDLNVRQEFEDFPLLTQAAVAGGVTFILEEPSSYIQSALCDTFCCDVGSVCTVDSSSLHTEAPHGGAFAFKCYLYPASPLKDSVSESDLAIVFEKAASLDLPVFLDPNLPNARLFHCASPLRQEPLERRKDVSEVPSEVTTFASSISEDVEESDEEEQPQQKKLVRHSVRNATLERPGGAQPSIIRMSSDKVNLVQGKNIIASNASGIPVIMEEEEASIKRTLSTVLDEEIRVSQLSIADLIKAEEMTYFYNQSQEEKTHSLSSVTQAPNTYEAPKNKMTKRPNSLCLSLIKAKTINESIYRFHLANFKDSWEEKGLNLALKLLSNSTCRVHFTGISSATTFNLIRKSPQKAQITCEIPATHLYFSSPDISNHATEFKTTPVIRNSTNFSQLWDLLKYEHIDAITSAHAPIDPMYKSPNAGFFPCALNGINCIGFSLQSVWFELSRTPTELIVYEKYLVRLAKWLSLYPAKILGISDQRGSIDAGKYADLIIWSPYEQVKNSIVYSDFPEMCPFAKKPLLGKIQKVYLRGKLAFKEGTFKFRGQRVFHL